MTELEMLQFIEDHLQPKPHEFSEWTLQEAEQFKDTFYNNERYKKIENRKTQIFECLLKRKQRKLLIV